MSAEQGQQSDEVLAEKKLLADGRPNLRQMHRRCWSNDSNVLRLQSGGRSGATKRKARLPTKGNSLLGKYGKMASDSAFRKTSRDFATTLSQEEFQLLI
jgi:hypothetical protein